MMLLFAPFFFAHLFAAEFISKEFNNNETTYYLSKNFGHVLENCAQEEPPLVAQYYQGKKRPPSHVKLCLSHDLADKEGTFASANINGQQILKQDEIFTQNLQDALLFKNDFIAVKKTAQGASLNQETFRRFLQLFRAQEQADEVTFFPTIHFSTEEAMAILAECLVGRTEQVFHTLLFTTCDLQPTLDMKPLHALRDERFSFTIARPGEDALFALYDDLRCKTLEGKHTALFFFFHNFLYNVCENTKKKFFKGLIPQFENSLYSHVENYPIMYPQFDDKEQKNLINQLKKKVKNIKKFTLSTFNLFKNQKF